MGESQSDMPLLFILALSLLVSVERKKYVPTLFYLTDQGKIAKGYCGNI